MARQYSISRFVITMLVAITITGITPTSKAECQSVGPNTENCPPKTSFDSPAQLAILSYAKNLTNTEIRYIEQIDYALSTYRNKLKNHPVYTKMNNEDNVKIFMNTHVYCVWDFMNLLKRLQIHFTSVQVPWRPTTSVQTRMLRRLANEIVLEEETDELDEEFISHFSYYLESIRQVQNGVISKTLSQFVEDITNTSISYSEIVNMGYLPSAVRRFLRTTSKAAVDRNIIVTAAAFTFGREVMLPEIFSEILRQSGVSERPNLSRFVKYLDRHIELDGDYHGFLTKKMVLGLATTPAEWDVVIETAKTALEARIALWDDIYKRLQ